MGIICSQVKDEHFVCFFAFSQDIISFKTHKDTQYNISIHKVIYLGAKLYWRIYQPQ